MSGEEGTLKSFSVLGMAYSIAHGVPWAGREVKQGKVLYLHMEGGDSLQDRRDAWKLANGFSLEDDADVFFLPEVLNMMDNTGNELEALVESINRRLGEPGPALIIVDTLSRAFGGKDPNTPKDMNLFVQRCDYLRQLFDCTVLIIHHTGWDTSREANARNLRNACDTVLMTSRSGQSLDVKLTFEKQKGAAHPKPLELTLEEIPLDDTRTSLAVPGNASLKEVTDQLALRSLEVLAGIGRGTYTEWRRECEDRGIEESAFKRDLKDLKREGWVPTADEDFKKGFEYSVTSTGFLALSENGSQLTIAPTPNIIFRPPSSDTAHSPPVLSGSSNHSDSESLW